MIPLSPLDSLILNPQSELYKFTALTWNPVIYLFLSFFLERILQLLMFGGHGTGGWLSRYDIYYNDCIILDRGENFHYTYQCMYLLGTKNYKENKRKVFVE